MEVMWRRGKGSLGVEAKRRQWGRAMCKKKAMEDLKDGTGRSCNYPGETVAATIGAAGKL